MRKSTVYWILTAAWIVLAVLRFVTGPAWLAVLLVVVAAMSIWSALQMRRREAQRS